MKTRLLRRLRRRANKMYYVSTAWADSGEFGIQFCVMHKEPLQDYTMCAFNNSEQAVWMSNRYKRQFIKNQVEQIRFKKLYK